jgi:hypothetical protein
MSAGMKPRIRIESDGLGHSTHVHYLPDEGEPVDISRCVTGVDVHIDVKDPNTATLHVILAGGQIDAELEDLIIRELKPRRRLRTRIREVTHFGSHAREWLRA